MLADLAMIQSNSLLPCEFPIFAALCVETNS
jgi:hypothetical protein